MFTHRSASKVKANISSTTRTHFIRGAFYALLLLAVCVISFALAQRTTAKGSRPVNVITVTNTNDSDPALNDQPLSGGCGLYEFFDSVTPPVLPPGWVAINGINPDGILWQTSNSGDPSPPAESLPNAVWVNDPAAISDKYLYSPSGQVELLNVDLHFSNNYALEDGFDGGVLEISVDGGPFQDILAAGGFFSRGGYNGTISTCCGNPLGGRQAWTGNSGGFIDTDVGLAGFDGHTIALRWRMGSDSSNSGEGWRVDNIYIVCEGPTPTATATATPSPTPTCIPAGTPGPWTEAAVYPAAVYGAAVASNGANIYAFGGNTAGGAQHAEAYRYDPIANTWTALASMTTGPDYLFHAEYGGNGKIYVMGGENGGTLNRIYDITTNTWSAGAPVPECVLDHGHAYYNGKVYVIGGWACGAASSAVYAYDVASNTWSAPLAPLPQTELNMATVAINGKIYVANGLYCHDQPPGCDTVNNLFIYDIAGNSWTSGPPSPLASEYPAGTAIGGKLYMIGGAGTNTYLYDPVANSWSSGPSLLIPRYFADAATALLPAVQTAVVVGGHNQGFSLNSVETSSLGACSSPTPTATPTGTVTATPTPTPTTTPTPTARPTLTPRPNVTPRSRPTPPPRP